MRPHWTVLQVSDPQSPPSDSLPPEFQEPGGAINDFFAITTTSCFLFSQGSWVPWVSDSPRWDSVRSGFLLNPQRQYQEEKSTEVRKKEKNQLAPRLREGTCIQIVMDPHLASRIVYSLRESKEFSAFLNEYFREKYPQSQMKSRRQTVRIVLDWTYPNKFDEPWEHRVWTLCMWHELLREHLAWLSTLGGAFSSLGKMGFSAFAEKAGKISVSQLRLSAFLNDPVLGARSRIFLAISLIQRRKLRKAQNILQSELHFCRREILGSEAEKVESIIRSVWDYLLHEKRRKTRSLEETRVLKERSDRLLFDDGTIRSKKSLADTILAMSNITLPLGC